MTIARAVLPAALVAAVLRLSILSLHAYPMAETTQIVPKEPEPRRSIVCTEQYLPVCGRLDNVVKTYSNQCHARAEGAEVIAQGPCNGAAVTPGRR